MKTGGTNGGGHKKFGMVAQLKGTMRKLIRYNSSVNKQVDQWH